MSTTTISTTTSNPLIEQAKANPLYPVISAYLDTVKTRKGTEPTEAQKENFILEAIANQLNPIKKQAYLIGYDTKDGANFSTIVSISGLTSIAARTREYAGIDQPRFTFNGAKLESCSVTVYRIVNSEKCAFVGNAYYDERVQKTYDGKPTEQWAKQPRTMLEKCARAAALRNAFPEQLGSFYDEAEMPPVEAVKVEPKEEFITDPQLKKILKEILPKLSELQGRTIENLQTAICETFKKSNLTELTKTEAQKVIQSALEKITELESSQSQEAESPLVEGQKVYTEV